MKKTSYQVVVALAGALGMSSSVSAAELFYVGLAGGYEDTSVTQKFAGSPSTDESVDGPAFGGSLGLELPTSFGYLGFEINASDSSSDSETITRQSDGSFQSETIASNIGYGLSGRVAFEVTERTHVYGLVGYQAQIMQFEGRNFDAVSAVTVDDEKEETFGGFQFGFGVHYELYDLVGVRLELSRIDFSEKDITVINSRSVELEQDRIRIGFTGKF
jgi:opacity protein-like surface antigen